MIPKQTFKQTDPFFSKCHCLPPTDFHRRVRKLYTAQHQTLIKLSIFWSLQQFRMLFTTLMITVDRVPRQVLTDAFTIVVQYTNQCLSSNKLPIIGQEESQCSLLMSFVLLQHWYQSMDKDWKNTCNKAWTGRTENTCYKVLRMKMYFLYMIMIREKEDLVSSKWSQCCNYCCHSFDMRDGLEPTFS